MSHYTRLKTKLKDKKMLARALRDMGFRKDEIQVHDSPRNLMGYENRAREQTAEIVIPRSAVGGAANDIGFKLQEDGTFQAIISNYDRGNSCSARKGSCAAEIRGYNQQWLDKLEQRYAYQTVKDQIEEQGLTIESEEEVDGEILIECTVGGW